MSKKIIIVSVLLLFVFALVYINRGTNEEGFTSIDGLRYETGAMHAEWGEFSLEILENGESTFTKTENLYLEKSYSFQTSEEELAKILNVARKNGFFSLNDYYEDPSIMDGGYDSITIFSGEESKTVFLKNINVAEFTSVESEINKLIYTKLGGDPYSFDDLKTECAEKLKECKGNKNPECVEWVLFCENQS